MRTLQSLRIKAISAFTALAAAVTVVYAQETPLETGFVERSMMKDILGPLASPGWWVLVIIAAIFGFVMIMRMGRK